MSATQPVLTTAAAAGWQERAGGRTLCGLALKHLDTTSGQVTPQLPHPSQSVCPANAVHLAAAVGARLPQPVWRQLTHNLLPDLRLTTSSVLVLSKLQLRCLAALQLNVHGAASCHKECLSHPLAVAAGSMAAGALTR
jgi:hypothetical protein